MLVRVMVVDAEFALLIKPAPPVIVQFLKPFLLDKGLARIALGTPWYTVTSPEGVVVPNPLPSSLTVSVYCMRAKLASIIVVAGEVTVIVYEVPGTIGIVPESRAVFATEVAGDIVIHAGAEVKDHV